MANPWSTPSTGPAIDFGEKYDASTIAGKSAVVTGGSAGIGRGCVEGLALNGAYVTFCDIDEEQGKLVEKELTEQGLNVKFVKTDVTSWDAVVGLFKAAIAFSPKETVDLVIPNAGVAGPTIGNWLAQTPLNSVTKDPLQPSRRVLEVNYLAVWNTVHVAAFYFKNFSGPVEDKHSKHIIFVSSMGGYTPMATVTDYNSSKWGVRGLFWSLRNTPTLLGEGKPGFRVNLIAPSWIRTNLTKGIQEAVDKGALDFKIGDVSDCVDVVLRMAADEGVIGRAAAVVPEKESFDLGDDSEGAGVGRALTDPDCLRRLGYSGKLKRVSRQNSQPEIEQVKQGTTQAEAEANTKGKIVNSEADAVAVTQQVRHPSAVEPSIADQSADTKVPVQDQPSNELKSEAPTVGHSVAVS